MARLSKRQKKNITKSFVLTRKDWDLIRQENYDWDSKDLKPIINRIRNFYKKEQNKLCAYCKLPFRDDIQVEHIVPKAGIYGRKEYTFYSKNLVVACKHCNSKKSTNNDMIPWNKKQYPVIGSDFKIIHPHFDNYFDHIEIIDKSRYLRKTIKGYKTIERCKLYDPVILEVLAEYMKYQDDPLISAIIRIRELQGDFRGKIDRLLAKIF